MFSDEWSASYLCAFNKLSVEENVSSTYWHPTSCQVTRSTGHGRIRLSIVGEKQIVLPPLIGPTSFSVLFSSLDFAPKTTIWLTDQRCQNLLSQIYRLFSLGAFAALFSLIEARWKALVGRKLHEKEAVCRILGPIPDPDWISRTLSQPKYLWSLCRDTLGQTNTQKKRNEEPDTKPNRIALKYFSDCLYYKKRDPICYGPNITSDDVKSILVRTGRWWVGWMGR